MNRCMSMYADTVFVIGAVVTVDRNNTVCQAVAVRDKYIVYYIDSIRNLAKVIVKVIC